jgi:hypothetical protein
MIGYAGTTHQSLDPVGDAVAKVAYFGNLEPLRVITTIFLLIFKLH